MIKECWILNLLRHYIPALLLFTSLIGMSQKPEIIKVDQLLKKLSGAGDSVYVVNFWATWCKPCVEEMPLFIELDTKAKERGWKVKILLVSMDFIEDYDKKLLPFIEQHKVTPEVVLLDEVNANYFIPKIENDWSGTLPFTLVLNYRGKKGERFYKEGQMIWDELLKVTGKE